jgi:SAM-dependent methyltransferase
VKHSRRSERRPITFPAAERNKGPILTALRQLLAEAHSVLEIASGTGQHVEHFAAQLPNVLWQPSDADQEMLDQMRLRLAPQPLDNVAEPILLDVQDRPWPVTSADAVLCINMIHIAPWSATESLMSGAAELLASGRRLILYGPFFRDDRDTPKSNSDFDAGLRARDPRWGVRRITEVSACSVSAGFQYEQVIEMPANNLIVVYRRA